MYTLDISYDVRIIFQDVVKVWKVCYIMLHYYYLLYMFYYILSLRYEFYDRFRLSLPTLMIVHDSLAHLSAHYFPCIVWGLWAVITASLQSSLIS